jgi:hypothetical protein
VVGEGAGAIPVARLDHEFLARNLRDRARVQANVLIAVRK